MSNRTAFLLLAVSIVLPASAQSTPAGASQSPPVTLYGALKPALDTVQQALDNVRIEKWKRGTVREEAGANIEDIEKDIQQTLPPLVTAADQAPGAISKALPAFRNVDALYDVLLRVVEAARVSAPADQVSELQEALIGLGGARRKMAERLQDAAAAQEKQIGDLTAQVQTQTAAARAVPPPAPAQPCTPPTPAKKAAKKKPKPPANPQQKPAGTQSAPPSVKP